MLGFGFCKSPLIDLRSKCFVLLKKGAVAAAEPALFVFYIRLNSFLLLASNKKKKSKEASALLRRKSYNYFESNFNLDSRFIFACNLRSLSEAVLSSIDLFFLCST